MTTAFPPSTIKAWQYSSTKGGLDKNLKINPSASLPKHKASQHLIQVIATALNPIDYKPAEVPFIHRLLIPNPATPGIDLVGRIVTPASGSSLRRGQLVFGVSGTNPLAGGALAEFNVADKDYVIALPDGVDLLDAATVGVAGISAYQPIVPRVKKGDKIFINGGSGGTGVFGIQIAKALGCHVTTACSTVNVELCKRLGADEVVDYKKGSVAEALKASRLQFDLIIDNVGADPDLFWHCHEYSKPRAVYVMIAGYPTLEFRINMLKMRLWPGFLGGGKRKLATFWPNPNCEGLKQIGRWMQEGTVKAVIDEKFTFEQAPQAIAKLKTGRAKGKIVVDVASASYENAWPAES